MRPEGEPGLARGPRWASLVRWPLLAASRFGRTLITSLRPDICASGVGCSHTKYVLALFAANKAWYGLIVWPESPKPATTGLNARGIALMGSFAEENYDGQASRAVL